MHELEPIPPPRKKKRRRAKKTGAGARAARALKAYIDAQIEQGVRAALEDRPARQIQAPADNQTGKPPQWRSRFGND